MERVAFIIESTGERLDALLNPEHVDVERVAGVRRRLLAGGLLTGAGLSDDRLIYSGGGLTRLELKLLFDVTLTSPTKLAPASVKELTGPFWDLSENQGELDQYGRPPLVRFVWGKSWNVLGIVSAVAERLEYFDTLGAPRRSWLSLRLTRVPDPEGPDVQSRSPSISGLPSSFATAPPEETLFHEVLGIGSSGDDSGGGEQLDAIAFRYFGDPAYWRFLAIYNDLDDPARLEPGMILQIPPRRIFEAF